MDDHDHHEPADHDELDADELEQLALSLSMDGSLGRGDAQRVATVLRRVAARRRHPSHRSGVTGQPMSGRHSSPPTI